jgi:hypothetical protein
LAGDAQSQILLDQVTLPDIVGPRRIELSGHVALIGFSGESEPVDWDDRDEEGRIRDYRHACDAVCAALLSTPGVASVTVLGSNWNKHEDKLARTFRLVPKGRCDKGTVIPQKPDQLELGKPTPVADPPLNSPQDAKVRDRLWMARAFENRETAWKIRLANSECIRADRPGTKFDFTIERASFEVGDPPSSECWSEEPGNAHVSRLRILDSKGTELLRRSRARVLALTEPRSKTMCGASGWPTLKMGWRRIALTSGNLDRAEVELARHTNIDFATDPMNTRRMVTTTLRKAMANSRLPASDPAFALAEPYFRLIVTGPIGPEDRALLADIIRDERVTDFRGFYDVVDALGSEGRILREPLLDRVGRTETDPTTKRTLSDALSRLPPSDVR